MNTSIDIRTVNTREAARLLGRAPQTLRHWACHPGLGPISPIRINGRSGPLRWSLKNIEQILLGDLETAIDGPFDADKSIEIDKERVNVEGARLTDD